MRFLRNIYLWMALGSILVVFAGDIYSRKYLSQPDSRENQQAEEERVAEGKSTDNLDPFLAGFFTAVVLGGFWY